MIIAKKYLTSFLTGVICYLFTTPLIANEWGISLGNLSEFVGTIQSDTKGNKRIIEFKPYLEGSYHFFLESNKTLIPEIELGVSIPKKGRDENILLTKFFLNTHLQKKFEDFYIKGGVGLYISMISIIGNDCENLNNGQSTTCYPLPSGSSYAKNLTTNFLIGLPFNEKWSAEVGTFIFNLTSNVDRAFTIVLKGEYHFGE